MSFFKIISNSMKNSFDVQMALSMKNEKMTVTIIPQFNTKQDDIVSVIKPISITDDPAELDRTLGAIISSAMTSTKDFADILKEYEKSLNNAQSKMEKNSSKTVTESKKEDKVVDTKPENPELINVNTGEVHTPPKEGEEEESNAPEEQTNASEEQLRPASAASINDIAGEDITSEETPNAEPENESQTDTTKEEGDDEEW